MNVKKTNTLEECDSAASRNRLNARFSEIASDLRSLGHENIEAVTETTRLLQAALGKLAGEGLASGQIGFETVVADCRGLATVRSPGQFMELQARIMERTLDQYFSHGPSLARGVIDASSRIMAPLHRQMKANMRSLPATA